MCSKWRSTDLGLQISYILNLPRTSERMNSETGVVKQFPQTSKPSCLNMNENLQEGLLNRHGSCTVILVQQVQVGRESAR